MLIDVLNRVFIQSGELVLGPPRKYDAKHNHKYTDRRNRVFIQSAALAQGPPSPVIALFHEEAKLCAQLLRISC